MDDSNHNNSNDYHKMGRRGHQKNYCWPGIYHITINVEDRCQQPLGRIAGDTSMPDGSPEAPHVELSAIGCMVEQELLGSIIGHYSMIEVQDYVIMPDHLHCIMVVHSTIISKNGRVTHLGQVIAGFKKGCNRRYWEITGQTAADRRGKPADTSNAAGQAAAHGPRPAVFPQGYKVPSTGSSHRPPLFASGYVDVMPLQPGQLEQQRQYIHDNPRYRLLRMQNRSALSAQRHAIDTLVTPAALRGFLAAAADGAVLVSPRIALGEQEIMDEAIRLGHPVILIVDNGFPEIYHPSEQRQQLCATGGMLLVSPWSYRYRPNGEDISVAECKAMNCVAQAICKTKDDWWKKL